MSAATIRCALIIVLQLNLKKHKPIIETRILKGLASKIRAEQLHGHAIVLEIGTSARHSKQDTLWPRLLWHCVAAFLDGLQLNTEQLKLLIHEQRFWAFTPVEHGPDHWDAHNQLLRFEDCFH